MSGARKPLLLFFSCVRSGPCRRMESVLAQVAQKERGRVDVVRIDLDDHAELARRLQVDAAPALLLVAGTRVFARLDGRATGAKIEAFLDAHLAVPAPA